MDGEPRTTCPALITGLNPATLAEAFATDPTNFVARPARPRSPLRLEEPVQGHLPAGTQGDGHGFGFVDPAEEAASNGAAGYYSFEPVPGLRFISLDTVSEGGRRPARAPTATSTTPSSTGSRTS